MKQATNWGSLIYSEFAKNDRPVKICKVSQGWILQYDSAENRVNQEK